MDGTQQRDAAAGPRLTRPPVAQRQACHHSMGEACRGAATESATRGRVDMAIEAERWWGQWIGPIVSWLVILEIRVSQSSRNIPLILTEKIHKI
jgi:hypothetical protein